ncbi:hypothetical protein BIU88_03500 [Chlorobaculum limnaeum]|uniref:Uncharacterized protein n=2 Tax=Chlorobaculum limnaeum TaxID=274537 RepID=A0A1D8D5S1_CHLLM|nr:hypothetical protein BIU88_03500 [Chlorobaculum limnaeum]
MLFHNSVNHEYLETIMKKLLVMTLLFSLVGCGSYYYKDGRSNKERREDRRDRDRDRYDRRDYDDRRDRDDDRWKDRYQ